MIYSTARSAFTIPNAVRSRFRPKVSAWRRAWRKTFHGCVTSPTTRWTRKPCCFSTLKFSICGKFLQATNGAGKAAATASAPTARPISRFILFTAQVEGHEAKYGVNHIGFLTNEMHATIAELSTVLKIASRPSTRPYAEFRFRHLEGNALDLSQTKG